MCERGLIVAFFHKWPNCEIACYGELLEASLLVSFPPAKCQKVHRPIDDLEEAELRPSVFKLRVKKEYPSANLIPVWPRKVVLPYCQMLMGVVIKTPSPLFDRHCPFVLPIHFNVIQVVVRDATRNILPQSRRQSVSGWTMDHDILANFQQNHRSTGIRRVKRSAAVFLSCVPTVTAICFISKLTLSLQNLSSRKNGEHAVSLPTESQINFMRGQ